MTDPGLQSCQAVWFVGNQAIDASALFRTVVGAAPHSAAQQGIGITHAHGADAERQYQCQVQPGRIDYFEFPREQPSGEFPTFANVEEALLGFVSRVSRGGSIVGAVARLAMVVPVVWQHATPVEAAEQLAKLTGLSLPFEDGLDLTVQINRRINIQGAALNRLMRWQQQQVSQIDLSDGQPKVKVVELMTLSLDVNTVPAAGVLHPADKQPAIWSAIHEQISKLAHDGRAAVLA